MHSLLLLIIVHSMSCVDSITVLLVMIALVIEGLMCKFVFLTPESSQQKTIVINNRYALSIKTNTVELIL